MLRKLENSPALLTLGPPMLLVLCIFAASPWTQSGVNDDWSYFWSARDLAATGHVHYNGWAAMMIGWQLYLGAAVVKLAGFSFTALRCAVLFLAVLTCALLQRLMVRFGITEWNSAVVVLALALTPTFQQLAFSFMTDIAGMLVLFGCIYAALRAVQARSDRSAIGWLAVGMIGNVAGGSVRQICWLGFLVVIPSAFFLLRERRRLLVAAFALWLAGVAGILWQMRWYKRQPFALDEPLLIHPHLFLPLGTLVSAGLSFGLMMFPVLFAFAWWRGRRPRMLRARAAILALVATALYARHAAHTPAASGFPLLGNLVSVHGIEALDLTGAPPVVIPPWMQFVLLFATFLGFCCAAVVLCAPPAADARPVQQPSLQRTRAILLGPVLAAYLALITTRSDLYDRYLLPLAFLASMFLVPAFQQRVRRDLPPALLLVIATYAAFGVAMLHDLYATDRARDRLYAAMQRQGIAATAIHGGYANDAWTQLAVAGYVNEPKITHPAGVYRPYAGPTYPYPCTLFSAFLTPVVQGPYIFTYQELPCFRASGIAPVPYWTWLAPRQRAIHIQRLPPG